MAVSEKYNFTHLMKRLGGENMPLCNFCGTCIGICPADALTADYERGKPIFDESKCTSCGLCYRYCQGVEVDFTQLDNSFKKGAKRDEALGYYRECFLGHATDDLIRRRGASGGSVTQLLVYLMEQKLVDGVILPEPKPDQKWLFRPEIVTDPDLIKASSQSKYCLIPISEILRELRGRDGRYAIVLLPCQVQSIRKLQIEKNREANKLAYLFALICGYNMEYGATVFGMRKLGVKRERVIDVKYREHGSWPGGMSFTLDDGEKRGMNFFNYHYLNAVYLPYRCRLCPDFYGNYSDCSFGDSWILRLLGRGMDEYGIPKGWSSIIARTKTGLELLRQAERDGSMHLERIEPDEVNESFPFNISYKTTGIHVRLQLARHKPRFIGLHRPERIKRYWYHLLYDIILVCGASKVFRFFIRLMPLNFLLMLIKNFKKLMGYKPNARDQILKYNEKSNVFKES